MGSINCLKFSMQKNDDKETLFLKTSAYSCKMWPLMTICNPGKNRKFYSRISVVNWDVLTSMKLEIQGTLSAIFLIKASHYDCCFVSLL